MKWNENCVTKSIYKHTQQIPKKIMDDNVSYYQHLLKMNKNQTHFLPITINTLNVLHHAYIYIYIQI